MNNQVAFTKGQRFWLWVAALAGLIGPNGVFVYCALYRWNDLSAALGNPVTLAFMVDAFMAMALLAYLFSRWRVGRLSPIWFIVLSIAGGLMFSVPAYVLLGSGKD
jgi:hypothetical protein